MKCPVCTAELAAARVDGVEALRCPAGHGEWMTAGELDRLEDEAFHLGDAEKGSLVLRSEPSERACPACGAPMRTFAYRLYDLELEYCPDGHGYWLDAGEDARVLALMKEEAVRLKRSQSAETWWAGVRDRLRSPSFLEKIRDLLR